MQAEDMRSRSFALDGLRGVAALAVVFYHAILHMDLNLVERVLYIPIQSLTSVRDVLTKVALGIFNGHMAVYIFFVLSGCVLTLSLNRRLDRKIGSTTLSFMLARIIRLYPPVIACMLLFYLMGYIGIAGFPQFNIQQFYQNASLTTISMHGPSTTVLAELLAVPFVLATWLARRLFGPAALVFALAYAVLAVDSGPMVFYLPNMHAYLIAFIVGMVVAEPAIRTIASNMRPATVWAIVAAMMLSRVFHHHASLMSLLTMTGLAATLVAALLYGPREGCARLLESPAAQALGRISFSFYLLNVPVLYLLWAFTDRWAWMKDYALETGLVVGAISVILTWPLADASECWIEQPSIAAGRRVSDLIYRIFRSRGTAIGDAAPPAI